MNQLLFDPNSPGAAALRAKIAATLLETLGQGAIDGDKAGALAQRAVAMLSAAGSAAAAAADPEALAASFCEFLEASVARDFAAWLLDHVGKHAIDYGFGEAGAVAAVGGGEAARNAGGVGAQLGAGGQGEEGQSDADVDAAAAAAAAAAIENVSEQSFRGGRGRGGGFARGRGGGGGGGGFAGLGRGGGGRGFLGISRGGRGGRGGAPAGVSKASSSSRSVFDRLGGGAAGAAADAAAAAAVAGGGDSAMAAADATAAGAPTPTPTTTTTTAAEDPARLRALREELVRLRQEAIKGAASASTSLSSSSVSSLAAGRTVLVKNVHFDATDASLAEHFRAAGLAVERATVARAGAGRGPSKGYGVVALLSVEAARRALALAGSTLEGREIDVVPARPTGIALEEGVLGGGGGGGYGGGGGRGSSAFRGRGGRGGGRRGAAAVAARGRGRGRGRSSASSFSYVRPELAAERATEAAAARRAALDAELDAFASGRG